MPTSAPTESRWKRGSSLIPMVESSPSRSTRDGLPGRISCPRPDSAPTPLVCALPMAGIALRNGGDDVEHCRGGQHREDCQEGCPSITALARCSGADRCALDRDRKGIRRQCATGLEKWDWLSRRREGGARSVQGTQDRQIHRWRGRLRARHGSLGRPEARRRRRGHGQCARTECAARVHG